MPRHRADDRYISEMYGRRGDRDSRERRDSRSVSRGGGDRKKRAKVEGEQFDLSDFPKVDEGADGPTSRENDRDASELSLEDLFFEKCPVDKERSFLGDCLVRVSSDHRGHGITRSLDLIQRVAATMNDAGVLDLMDFSVQAASVLKDMTNDGVIDPDESACGDDLVDLVRQLRRRANSAPDHDRVAASKLASARPKAKPGRSPRGDDRGRRQGRDPVPRKHERVDDDRVDPKSRDNGDRKRARSKSPLDRLESSVRKLRSEVKRDKRGDMADDDDDLVQELDKNHNMSRTVNKLLADKSLEYIDSDFLPDPKNIVDLHNVFLKHKCPYISSKPLDDMVPVHVVQGLPSQEKKDVLKTRTNETMTMARLLELVMAFWMSHHVAGMVSLGAIVQQVMILTKMAQKKNVLTAVWYSRYLPAHVSSVVNKGKMTVDDCLTKVLDEVEKKVTDQLDPREKKGAHLDTRKKKGGRRNNFSRSPKPRRRARDKSVSKEKEAASPPVPRKEQVCLAHDPANGKKCTRENCQRKHLDTKVPKNAKLYLETKNLVQKLRRPR